MEEPSEAFLSHWLGRSRPTTGSPRLFFCRSRRGNQSDLHSVSPGHSQMTPAHNAIDDTPFGEISSTHRSLAFCSDLPPSGPALERSATPMIFGKYELLERIAVGGMAEVFRARLRGDGGFEKHLVIKRILPHLSSDSDFVVMLIDEARIAVSLTHPNIVQIYDLGKQDGTYYIAMELIEGGDLKVLLHRLRTQQLRMPIAHALHIGIETLKGLEYAHQKMGGSHEQPVPLNIIHRDISPPNILISYEGEVKLVDFGIAKASVRLMETSAGILKGKYEYMSPEQAMGLVVDHRSDLFSAGVVLYELLTGHSPFAAVTDLKVLQNVRAAQCIPPSQHNPEIPPALDAIVLKSLRRERDERYQRASEMRAELNAFAFAGRHLSNAARLAGFMRSLFAEEIRLGKVAHLDQIVSGPGPGAPGGSPAPSAPPPCPQIPSAHPPLRLPALPGSTVGASPKPSCPSLGVETRTKMCPPSQAKSLRVW